MHDGPEYRQTSAAKAGKVLPAPRHAVFGDLYHYLVTISWPALLSIIVGLFVLSNTLFAFAYMLDGGIRNAHPGSFADAFFFSVQTMATIGYGQMVPQSPSANVMVSIEALSGLIALAVVTGLVFARFSRPTARVRFSRVAVISRREGVPSLMFRMANERSNQIVEAQINAALLLQDRTVEGEIFRRARDLALVRYRHPIFGLTWLAIHPIDETSPLFGATPESLKAAQAMLIVSLTGLDESFSQTIHARHEWTDEEILWGMRFDDVLRDMPDGRVSIDYSRFDQVVPAQTDRARADGPAAETGNPGAPRREKNP